MNPTQYYFSIMEKETRSIFWVPTKLNILHRDSVSLVYDPVSQIVLTEGTIPGLLEEFCFGFLDCMKSYGEMSSFSSDRWADDTAEYGAYLAGINMAMDMCEHHMSRGGTFGIV